MDDCPAFNSGSNEAGGIMNWAARIIATIALLWMVGVGASVLFLVWVNWK